MTFSIIARACGPSSRAALRGDASDAVPLFGIAVASSSPAASARCALARAGVGAVVTQSMADPALAQHILEALEGGAAADTALAASLRSTPYSAYRQLLAIGRTGAPAAHNGAHVLGVHTTALADDAAAAGNRLADAGVPSAMLASFAASVGQLPARLLRALRGGLRAGGAAAPLRSAGLLVFRDLAWPLVDLRIDWHESDPLGALEGAFTVYEPQIEAYLLRAIHPTRVLHGDLAANP